MRCLLIGGSGFLGSNLVDLGSSYEVVATGRTRCRGRLQHLDLRNTRSVRAFVRETAPDVVVYAAGMTSVDASERSPTDAFLLNADVPGELAAECGGRFVYFSTDYVFDGARGHYAEEDGASPINTYGASKLTGEQNVLAANATNVVVRVSGLFDLAGTRDERFVASDGAPTLARQDDRCSSPIHVLDVRGALKTLLASPYGGVFHAGGPHALSRYEFRQIVNLHRGARTNVRPVLSLDEKPAAPRPRDTSLRSRKLEALGWRARSVADWFSRARGAGGIIASPAAVNVPDGVDAVLVDCVGGLLGARKWLSVDPDLDAMDAECAHTLDGAALWENLPPNFGDRPAAWAAITRRYAPNPYFWNAASAFVPRTAMALTNNGPSSTFRLWVEKYGLDRVFDVLANSEEIGLRKPDPRFYLEVARRLGVAPQRCLVLDDDARNVDGARRCNMQALQTAEQPSPAVSGFTRPRSAFETRLGQHGETAW